jgi:hypothetical protein
MANRIQETQTFSKQNNDFQLLKLFHGHVIAWHKTNGLKAAFLEHVIGRISFIAIPLFAAGDAIIGVGIFFKRSFLFIVIKPFSKETDVTFKDLYQTAKRVLIIVALCPVFAVATLFVPEKAAYFYFKTTSQNPYCVSPGLPVRDHAVENTSEKIDVVPNSTKFATPLKNPPPKTTTKEDHVDKDPISSMLERAKSMSTLVVEKNQDDAYDAEWDDIPVAHDHHNEVRTMTTDKMPQMLYTEPKNGSEVKFDRHQNEFLERYQKILKGNPYKAPIPGPEKTKAIAKPVRKVEKKENVHPTISRANTPLTERDFKARLAKANLAKTRLLIPHSEQATILEVEKLDQYVYRQNSRNLLSKKIANSNRVI